jgi:large subunit ribosomal protein L20
MMTRIKGGNIAQTRYKRIRAITAGSKRAHSRLTRTANQQLIKTLIYSNRDRNRRKSLMRYLWNARINAAARQDGISYSKLIYQLYQYNVIVNCKILAQLVIKPNLNTTYKLKLVSAIMLPSYETQVKL